MALLIYFYSLFEFITASPHSVDGKHILHIGTCELWNMTVEILILHFSVSPEVRDCFHQLGNTCHRPYTISKGQSFFFLFVTIWISFMFVFLAGNDAIFTNEPWGSQHEQWRYRKSSSAHACSRILFTRVQCAQTLRPRWVDHMPICHKTLKVFTSWPWLRKIDSQLIKRNLMCRDSAGRLVHSFCVDSSSLPFPKGQFRVLIVRLGLA